MTTRAFLFVLALAAALAACSGATLDGRWSPHGPNHVELGFPW
jgi:hypothetical protein